MAKLMIVAGLPGAGKSTYIETLRAASVIDWFYDDYQAASEPFSEDPTLSGHYEDLICRLRKGQKVAVADILYCNHEQLSRLEKAVTSTIPDVQVDIRAFENDPHSCVKNVRRRARPGRVEMELTFIERFSQSYDVAPHVLLPVYTSAD